MTITFTYTGNSPEAFRNAALAHVKSLAGGVTAHPARKQRDQIAQSAQGNAYATVIQFLEAVKFEGGSDQALISSDEQRWAEMERTSAVADVREHLELIAASLESSAREVRRYIEQFNEAVAKEDNGEKPFTASSDVYSWAIGHAAQATSNMRFDMVGKRTAALTATRKRK